jgi:hypothetical protein
MIATLADGFTEARGLAARGDELFVADTGEGALFRVAGPARALVAEIEAPVRVAAAGDALYVTSCTEEGALVRVDARGARPVIEGLAFPAEVALDGDGDGLWVTCLGEDRDGGSVRWLRRDGGDATVAAAGLFGPTGLAPHAGGVAVVDAAGRLLHVAGEGRAQPRILFDPGDAPLDDDAGLADPDAVLGSSAPLLLVPELPVVFALAAHDGQLAWIGADGALRWLRPGAPPPARPRARAQLAAADVTYAAGWFFAVEAARDRIVALRSGDEHARPRVIVRDEAGILALTVANDRLCWTTAAEAGGALRALALSTIVA